ncbi:putative disease resistance protein [Glycine max]|nr:putative disease resistance protein [Glycine max]
MKQKSSELPNDLVGENFNRNIEQMWELLGDDQVFIIGIHGMAGVGKTALVTYIENDITRKGSFKHAVVTVSQVFSIFKLQNDIANRIGMTPDEDDERMRAIKLSLVLERKEKTVLILDDVWKNIDLQKVGVPLRVNGIKLILTSRLEHATPAKLPHEVEKIARSIVKECDGLPLGISVMASTMKGVNDIRWWRHALNKLQKSEMEVKLFNLLKLSHDNLTDNMQNFFLSCALYHQIGRKTLVLKFFDEGLINDTASLERVLDEGLTIVDKLKSHSLLLESDYLHMHGLVQKMVCHILNQSYMVNCNEGLTKAPDMQEWTADLKKDCFFSHMSALAVLDLSCNPFFTLLPNAVSNLRLKISGTSIEKVPEGLGKLINLKWLDLSENYNLTLLPGSVLPGLTNKQYLDICYNYGHLAKVNAEDVQGMTMLEHFAGSFHDWDNFNNYVQATLDRGSGPKTYHLHLGIGPGYSLDYSYDYNFLTNDECRIVSFRDCTKLDHVLPTDIARLCIAENKQWRCLCDVLSFRSPSLMYIDIRVCPKLESLFCLTGPCSLCSNLQNLESLNLTSLEGPAEIWKENEVKAKNILLGGMFSHIKHLEVSKCHKIEKLLTIGPLLQLKNLVSLDVKSCDLMKEIFTVSITEDVGRVNEITLPKLTRLEFRELPQLKTVWWGIIKCGLSPKLNIRDCPQLETPPILQSIS